MNNKWNKFLDGLATDGGNLFVLFSIILLLGLFVHLQIPGSSEQLNVAIGALIGILKGTVYQSREKFPIVTPPQNKSLLTE